MEAVFQAREKLPPHLLNAIGKNAAGIWSLGNLNLLKQQALSFCGSRKASEKALEAAGKCATEAVNNNIGTISGNAAGVDLTVHSATLEAGGWSIFVLPEGIKHFRIKKALSDIWDWDRCLVISPYEPDDRWQVWRAMDRNELIIALGIAMIVVEAGETGGTREVARQALKIGKPLFALSYRDSLPGNEAILRDGAKKLGISNVTGKPNIKKVISNVGDETPQSEPEKQVMLL